MERARRAAWLANTTRTVRTTVAAALARLLGAQPAADTSLQRFFELSDDLMVVAGFDGEFKSVNAAWERALGYAPAEMLNRPFLDFVHPDDVEPTRAEVERQLGGGKVIRFANRYRAKDGSWHWLEWSSTPADGSMFGVARDVTHVRKLESELKSRVQELGEVNAELEAFSYSVSHDLRAPVRHVAGFTELLEKKQAARLDDEGRRYLGLIRGAANRMGMLIDDLLAFSRVGRAELAVGTVDLTVLIAQVWEEVSRDAGERNVTFTLRDLPKVQGDPALLRSVFANLLGNALKYTGPRPVAEITVEGRAGGGVAVIVVRDNGVGFNMKYVDKLFGVFQRLHSSDQFEGTGIGLATVRRIVHRHEGRVWAEGAEEAGAAFHVALPAAANGRPA